jgi:hypothetical protein
VPLYISESAHGEAAKQWVSQFHELIGKSSVYCLVSQKEKAVLVVSILGRDADLNGISTAMSIAVYTVKYATFLDHWMYISGKDSLESSAQRAVAALEKEVDELKKLRLVK